MKFGVSISVLYLFLQTSVVKSQAPAEYLLVKLSVGDECENILKEFAHLLPQFIQCSILNARPFSACERCVQYYGNVTRIYQKMISAKDNSSRSCEEVLLNVDRVQVVRQFYKSIINLWEQSKCDYCFTTRDDGTGHIIYELSNNTVTFNEYAHDTFKCISGLSKDLSKDIVVKVHPKNDTICKKCKPQYDKLNKFYLSLGESSENFCMDLVDKMNASRIVWSQHLGCIQYTSGATPGFLSFITIVCISPFLFYFMAWWRSTRQEQCIVPQKRFHPEQDHTEVDT